MTPENFVYWLQGYFELSEEAPGLSANQTQKIKDHLDLVLTKVAPDRPAILDFLQPDPHGPKLCSAKLPEHPGKPFKK